MIITKNIKEFNNIRKDIISSIGFVPTMGALHEGHISLIKQAREENDTVIVSIFVNPTQFLEGEDLDSYPRREQGDIEICKRAGVDILFMPDIIDMYSDDELKILAPLKAGYILEGASRAGHFDGMLQIVMKLLNLINPSKAYFGKKDAQQLSLIKKMVKDYFMRVEIVACDIVRDIQGLALSSRNLYLTPSQKITALKLSSSLKIALLSIGKGELKVDNIKNIMINELQGVTKIDYVEIVDYEFKTIDKIEMNNTIILVACFVGTTRLIDNIWI
ncbi:Pantoate--beta-alanine ligase [hydrothermal vent metagenome]|uniref:pantoate--beta-alanine ligase (AMP-forming) n=1 Tax=hydrothermal vent metagenome TaxID=652676 RepID=A0A1W1EIF4_9ZZZZ